MRTRCLMTLGAAALAAGCSLPPPADVDHDADLRDATQVDAAVDAAPVCVPDSIVCDEGTGLYVDCDSEGAPEVVIDCPLGCAPDVEKCLDVVASNGLTGYLDQARDDEDVVSVSFTGVSTMNTDTGVVMIGANEVEIPNTTANGIRVFMFKFLTISGTLKFGVERVHPFHARGDSTENNMWVGTHRAFQGPPELGRLLEAALVRDPAKRIGPVELHHELLSLARRWNVEIPPFPPPGLEVEPGEGAS